MYTGTQFLSMARKGRRVAFGKRPHFKATLMAPGWQHPLQPAELFYPCRGNKAYVGVRSDEKSQSEIDADQAGQ